MTELIWDGKYVNGKRQAPVRVALPFQTIETVNESAADRHRTLELFATGRPTEWRNRLIWGDKKYVLPSLLSEFAGKVNLIYIDPPFDTGADFSFTASIPGYDDDGDGTAFIYEPSILEQKAYRDTWGRGLDSYMAWFYETAVLMHELLAENGSLYVHLDWHVAHHAKAVLDEVFGLDNFRNEIIWKRASTVKGNFGQGSKLWSPNTENIFYYTKTDNYSLKPIFLPYSEEYIETFFRYKEPDGRRYRLISMIGPGGEAKGNPIYEVMGVRRPWRYSKERMEKLIKDGLVVQNKPGTVPQRKQYLEDGKGVAVQTLWDDIEALSPSANERVGYPTQKPEALLQRIIEASSDEGDLVLDCFGGSGTTSVVAEKLGRRWITCDLGRFAIHTTRKRLLSIPRVKPFSIQNLGKYERQVWQTAQFRSPERDEPLEQQRLRETAYRKFILDLYHATPLSGSAWLHGIKSGRMVHVGAVDAPVTLADVRAIARDVWKASPGSGEGKKAAADILGWDFAFEMNETAKQIAAESRVDVVFKRIPREVLEKKAVEQGDVKFFELGALAVASNLKKRELVIELTDFVIPIDDVPEEARKSIQHWSQMIDYWAVDWDFKDDTFHNQWQSYRTRQDPKLELKAKFDYSEPGDYKVVVKVIDILGNDTTKTLDIKVR